MAGDTQTQIAGAVYAPQTGEARAGWLTQVAGPRHGFRPAESAPDPLPKDAAQPWAGLASREPGPVFQISSPVSKSGVRLHGESV